MPKNYYLVLGIASEATPGDIKDAYRRLVKEFHPDHYGNNHSPFLAIQEAYSVLSDPIKRQSHDSAVLSQKKTSKPMYEKSIRPDLNRHVEPLIPEHDAPMDLGTAHLGRSFHSYSPSYEELFDSIFNNFRQTSQPKRRDPENLNVVITLTREQAFRGGQINVELPAELTCPSCLGKGWLGMHACCWRCDGKGILSGEYPLMIGYPPGISDNHAVQIPLDYYGIKNLYLTVHFRISNIR